MGLRWDVEQVEDFERVCFIGEGDERRLNPVTEVLIWATISVKLGSITEKNAAEFYARLRMLERLDGFLILSMGKGRSITPEEVRAHIGLTCNVVNESRAVFLRTIRDDLDRDVRAYATAIAEAEAA